MASECFGRQRECRFYTAGCGNKVAVSVTGPRAVIELGGPVIPGRFYVRTNNPPNHPSNHAVDCVWNCKQTKWNTDVNIGEQCLHIWCAASPVTLLLPSYSIYRSTWFFRQTKLCRFFMFFLGRSGKQQHFVWSQIKQTWVIITYLKLWVAVARHNFKWAKI